MWWIFFAIVATAIGYWIIRRPYKYWSDRGVDQGSPIFPFGDNLQQVLRKQSLAEMEETLYKMFPKKRYSGFYQFLVPTLLIRDPALIKQILVKDFDHFMDHQNIMPGDVDPLWTKNLLFLKGQKWREMRTILSPSFTTSKIKHMFSLISPSCQQFVSHFLKKNEDIITLEMKNIFTRFTNDVIANTAFGVECDSLSDTTNEFYLMGKEATEFTGLRSLKFMAYFLVPQLCKMFKVNLFSQKVSNFFTQLVKTNIASREKHNIVRPDMINLLLEARKNLSKYEETSDNTDFAHAPRRELTDTDIASQAVIFLFGGFETVSSLMCFMSYELAINPEIQERLRQEVDDTLETCKGKLTYEAVLGMKYMDMVVSESLRKWPSNVATDRIVTKAYTIKPKFPDEKPVHLKENDAISVPIFALHRDPEYFPDPDRFDPERFSGENKDNIKPYTYLPFGAGPRSCIGSRLALLETKTLFCYLLTHFEIIPVAKTKIPLVIRKDTLNIMAEGGFWLGLKRRMK